MKVAGTATIIHHTKPIKNSLPLPLTKLLTTLPSSSATYKLSKVLITKKTLWLMRSRNSLLFQLDMMMRKSLNKLRKNSRLISTLFFFSAPTSPVVGLLRSSACRCAAAFCSAIALCTRCIRAMNKARYTPRPICLRFLR